MINRSLQQASSHLALALSLGLGLALVPAPAMAQARGGETPPLEDDLHNQGEGADQTIIVSASGVKELDVLAGTSVLEVREIQREAVTGQIGDLLAKIPGVSATGFAPGASRPVLRG